MGSFGKAIRSLARIGALLGIGLMADGAAAASAPVGIALEIEDGAGVPVQLKAGGRYYVNQLDMRAFLGGIADAGVEDLAFQGDFADLPWHGVRLADEDFVGLANADGTFTRRRFYTDAAWMELPSWFFVQQVDSRGRGIGPIVPLNIGFDELRLPTDDFFVRRTRAIQWTRDCPSLGDCTNARNVDVEALVELRNARGTPHAFDLDRRTTALRVVWSLKPWELYEIPVQQVGNPEWDYGFQIAVHPVTPPQADGTYAPGTDVTFRLTLQDGNGKALHEPGVLPSYTEGAFMQQPAGIRYYNAFSDASTTYYRRKHRERMLMTQIIGPAHHVQPIRSVASLESFLTPGTQTTGLPARDGVYSEVQIVPEAYNVFGGAFGLEPGLWDEAASDLFTFHLPADAAPGTYIVTVKGRRVYLGEDIPATTNIEIQVGQTARTVAHLTTGNCQSCHNNGGELTKVLHANGNRAACAGCHAPLSFELEGPIVVRTHFIHSRSDRFDAPLQRCSSCHTEQAGIQRASPAACLSCHKSYPESHVAQFGPVDNMYVGTHDGVAAFTSCTDSCHQNHPGSGF